MYVRIYTAYPLSCNKASVNLENTGFAENIPVIASFYV